MLLRAPCGRLGWCWVEEIPNMPCTAFSASAVTDRADTGDRVCFHCWHLERCHTTNEQKGSTNV
jgi:hypothetical protein